MTRIEIYDFVDDKDPDWFYAWCEREGSWEEILQKVKDLGGIP